MRNDNNNLGIIILIMLILIYISIGFNEFMNLKSTDFVAFATIQDDIIPLSDGEDSMVNPEFTYESENTNDYIDANNTSIPQKKKRNSNKTEESTNISEPAGITDVTETEEIVDLEIEQEINNNTIPETASVRITVNPDGPVEYGQTVKLSAHVRGFGDCVYELNWQVKKSDEEDWENIIGAHGKSLKLVIGEDNIEYKWRVVAILL